MTKITESHLLDHCLISGKPVRKIMDFGQHPYADTFIADTQLNLSEPVFPLQLYLSEDSGHIQLGYMSPAEDRYNLYSYSYTSSNSQTARNHWNEYAETIRRQYNPKGLVVEIGSNDGYLIKQFQAPDNQVVGVDSSSEMCAIARQAGVECINSLFDQQVGAALELTYGPAGLVMANNVFNHANDPVGFAKGVADLLSDNGIFVFEVPYWLSMIESGRFVDMVYHEHPSYFTIKSVHNLLHSVGLEIVDFDVVNYHGGSLRVVAQRDRNSRMPAKVEDAIAREEYVGLFSPDFYLQLQQRFERMKVEWLAKFYRLLEEDPTAVVIGVGAAAKANTWLRWHGLDSTVIKCITDASPFKQGKYTPLTRIPIRGDEEFARHANPYALVLSWNIGEPLKQALLKINPNTRFISQ